MPKWLAEFSLLYWTCYIDKKVKRQISDLLLVRPRDRSHICLQEKFRNHMSKFNQICMHVVCDRGSVNLWRSCNTLCTSGYANDVMSSHNGPYGACDSNDSPGGSMCIGQDATIPRSRGVRTCRCCGEVWTSGFWDMLPYSNRLRDRQHRQARSSQYLAPLLGRSNKVNISKYLL